MPQPTGTELDFWAAPYATVPIDARVSLPGSKSMTNRALVLAALANGPGRVTEPLRARDTFLMADALRALGTQIDDEPDGSWVVTPSPLRGPAQIDCGLAGTVLRFVPPVAALANGDIGFDGDARLRERPIAPLLAAMRQLGAVVKDEGRGSAPFVVRGTGGVSGGTVHVRAAGSSQLISGLLLAAARFESGVEVVADGPVPSAPYLEMNIAMLRERDVQIEAGPGRWSVRPGAVRGLDCRIEPDLNSAAPFAAAALVTGGQVRLPGWPPRTSQPGGQLPALLSAMGGSCELSADGLTVSGGSGIHGLEADLGGVSELAPVLAVLAALADSPSRFTGIAHTRGHETDRIAALAAELSGCGADIEELPDGLVIHPRPMHGRSVATYDDHRMVMAAAVLGLAVPNVVVVGTSTVAKTMPDFVERWAAMLQQSPEPIAP